MDTVSATMIVKNEEAMLGTCLASLHGFDEICIIDTGSTDGTPDVIKAFESESGYNINYVFGVYQWNDDFSEARNLANKYATKDWCFVIDADEYLEPGGIRKIKAAISSTDKRVLSIVVESLYSGSVHSQPRLYRKAPDIYWKAAIHNYLSIRAEQDTDVRVYYGRSPAHKGDPDRTLRILLREIEENPDLVREVFYLAREYTYRRQWETAIEHYKKYLKRATWGPEIAEAHLQMAKCLQMSGKWQEARRSCLHAIGVNPDFKKALLFMAELSGPTNKEKWTKIAEHATNKDVLFT